MEMSSAQGNTTRGTPFRQEGPDEGHRHRAPVNQAEALHRLTDTQAHRTEGYPLITCVPAESIRLTRGREIAMQYGMDDAHDAQTETYSEYQRRMEYRDAENEQQNDPQHIADQNATMDKVFGPSVVVVKDQGNLNDFLKALGFDTNALGALGLNMDAPVAVEGERQCAAEPYLTSEDIFTLADVVLLMRASVMADHAQVNRSFQRQVRLHLDGLKGFDGHLSELAQKLIAVGTDMFAGRSTGLHRGEF
jgi:hypothetical protein